MQSFASTWRQTTIRQPLLLNMSKRLAWRWVEEPTDNNATGPEQRQQFNSRNILAKNSQQLDKDSNCSTSTTNISSNIVKMLRDEFRAQIDAVEAENKVLLAKMDLLQQACNDGLQARLDTMEQKLKVVEQETKLAKQEIHTLIGQKVTNEAITGQLLQKNGDERKMASDDGIMKTEVEAKKMDEIIISLRKKIGDLVDTAVDGQNKLEQMLKALGELNLNKLLWRSNKWNIPDEEAVKVSADGLTVTNTKYHGTNIRAAQPVSRAMLAFIPGQKLFYWEVQMKNERISPVGWIATNFSLKTDWIGEHPNSFAINWFGNYFESGRIVKDYGKWYDIGDVVGSGLLLTRDNRLKLFFTLNGALNGEPIVLKDSQELLFFPAVRFVLKDASVEVNFGADPTGKPFMFDVNAHETELFD